MSQQQITTPNKSPGDTMTASEQNSEKAVVNNNATDALSKADGGDLDGVLGIKDTSIELKNSDGTKEGLIKPDSQFGVLIAGSDDGVTPNRPVTTAGTIILNSADTYGMKFQSAAVGDFLRLVAETDVNGNPIFTLGTTPLDVEEYNQQFTNSSDVTVTTSYQNIVQGTVINEYRDGTSSAFYDFLVENSTNSDQQIQFSITSNDGAVTEVFTATVPRNQAGQNGQAIVSGSDSIDGGSIIAGSTVEIKVKSTTANGLTVKGTTNTTTLKMSQNASLSKQAYDVAIIAGTGISVKTTSYGAFIEIDPSAGDIVKTLPSASEYEDLEFSIKRTSNSENTVKLSPAVGEFIDAIPSTSYFVLGRENDSIRLRSNGSKWFIIERNTSTWASMSFEGVSVNHAVTTGWAKLTGFNTNGYLTPGIITPDHTKDCLSVEHIEGALVDGYNVNFNISFEYANNTDIDFAIYVGGVSTNVSHTGAGRGNKAIGANLSMPVGVYQPEPKDIEIYVKGDSASNLKIYELSMSAEKI